MNRESADQVQRTPRDGLENQNAQVDDDDKDLPELNIEDQANETDPPIFTGRAWRKLKIILIGIGLVANIATRFALVFHICENPNIFLAYRPREMHHG